MRALAASAARVTPSTWRRTRDGIRPTSAVTRKMLDAVEKLHPSVQERLGNNPAIMDVVRGMAERDAEFAAAHGLKQRPDV